MSRSKLTPCSDTERLRRFLDEQLSEAEEALVQEHVDGCGECRATLEGLAGDPDLWHDLERVLQSGSPEGRGDEAEESLRELVEHLGPTDDPAMLGRLGHYEVCGLIGRGSTGVVVKALEPRLNRYVAIKLMAPTYRSSAVARQRFEREGRAVAAVAHEHVVPIYAVEEHRGSPYIVMQYVSGLSLQGRIERDGPLDTCEVVRVGLQVAKALAAAHAQGIVHRDVKPANVILESSVDRVFVTDFGLARVADEVSMTRSGAITGTPQYMSPEQAKGESVDPRSDLFSLGSLMYAACTGRPPFRAQTLYGVIHRVCEAEPRPIRELRPEIRGWLAALIAKLMAKRPGDRFQSAAEVEAVLAGELAHLQNPTAVAAPARDWRVDAKAPGAPGVPGAPEARGLRGAHLAAGLTGLAAVAALAVFAARGGDPGGREPSALAAGFQIGAGLTPAGLAEDPVWSTGGEFDGDATVDQVLERSFALAAGERVTLRIDRGSVVVEPAEVDALTLRVVRKTFAADEAAAERLLAHHDVRVDAVEGGLAVNAGFHADFVERGGLDEFLSVDYVVGLPAGVHANVASAFGNVLIGAITGDVDVETEQGGVELAHVDGAVFVRARGGDVDLSHGCSGPLDVLAVHGDVRLQGARAGTRVRTSSGNVVLGPCSGDVYVQTSGGDVSVLGLEGPTAAHTEHGDILVRLAESPVQEAIFSASDGDIALYLAEPVAADIESRGRVETAFAYELREPAEEFGESWTITRHNGGGARVQATSTLGEVRVARLEDPSEARFEATGSGTSRRGDSGLGGSGLGGSGLGGSGLGGSGLGGSGLGGSGLGGSGLGGSGLGGSGLGGSGLGGSGLGGSGLGGSGLGGSGHGISAAALAKTTGAPRPGALATVALPDVTGDLDGYTLYLPISYAESGEDYPVLVYLQGSYGVGGAIGDLNNWGLARLLRDEHDLSSERNRLLLDEFIVVCPHIQDGQYYDEPERVQAILDGIFEDYRADADRVYLTGLSRGAHGSWGLAARLPETFAAIVPIGGSAGSVEDFTALAGTSIWIAHNAGDPILDYTEALDAAVSVEEHCGVDFREFDGHDVSGTDFLEHRYLFTTGLSASHDAWTQLYTSPELYEWLLRQRRSEGTRSGEPL